MTPPSRPDAAPDPAPIPAGHADLLERPLYGHLATLRADGTPQVNPMWYRWDGTFLSFTTSRTRRKFANVQGHPAVAMSVTDPDRPYRYLEVRGVVERIDPDPQGAFFDVLARRYGLAYEAPVGDAADRVVLRVRPTGTSAQ